MIIERQVQQRFLRLLLPHPRLHLSQRLAHKQYSVDQETIGGAFDLEVAEEGVGAEEGEYFVQGVVGFAVGVNVNIGEVGDRRKGVGWATGFGAEGKDAEVAFLLRISMIEEGQNGFHPEQMVEGRL